MWIGFWICFEFRQKSIKLQFCFISLNSSSLYWCCLFGYLLAYPWSNFRPCWSLYPIWLHIWVWHNISVCQRRFSTWGVYWERINLSFCASTVTDIIRPALCEFSNSTLKFLDPCKVLLLRFWCYRAMKKSATYPVFFPKNNVFISTMRFRRSIISNFKLRKVWKILFLLLLSWRPRTFKDAISNLLILKNL